MLGGSYVRFMGEASNAWAGDQHTGNTIDTVAFENIVNLGSNPEGNITYLLHYF